MIGRLLKYLIYLGIVAALALIAYTLVGPFFGADFSTPSIEIRIPVTLDVN